MDQRTTENMLFKALNDLLQKKTIDKLSVTEIIKEAGISRATFYRYYADKYDLLNSSYRKILERTLFQYHEGVPWEVTEYNLYKEIRDNVKIFQNAIESTDINSLKNYIFDVSMDFHLGILKDFNVDISDWKVRKQMESFTYGNLEITVLWIKGGAKEPLDDFLDVLNSMIPENFKPYFLSEETRKTLSKKHYR